MEDTIETPETKEEQSSFAWSLAALGMYSVVITGASVLTYKALNSGLDNLSQALSNRRMEKSLQKALAKK